MIAPALTERAAKSFEPNVIDQVDIYLRQVLEASRSSRPLNMSETVGYLTLDTIAKLSFGYHLRTQTSNENRFVHKALASGLYRGNVWHQVFFLSKLYLDKIFDRIFDYRARYLRLLEKMVKSRLAKGADGERDFYSFISEFGEVSGNERKKELWFEANFLIIAGSDTTAAATSSTFFYLSSNPECYQKLASEVRSTFAEGGDIKGGPQLASCRYLRACIDEAMRMSPPAPGVLWRMQDPNNKEPLVIDGHVIPPRTLFGVSAYAIHHNEQYFPDSFSYKPSRWLGADDGSKVLHDAFAAFSIGSRGCAGKSMAYLESSLILAKTLWYFDFEMTGGKLGEVGGGKAGDTTGRERPGEFQLEDIFTTRHNGPYLAFHLRGDYWKDLEADV
ncbi:hypothetical protein JX265_001372 [Neoarthrinium moseri]|uniref:Cytochrome P450 n=1 Tax=Neoarthrinium moseri TaxID=1658444 RepID=A0A9P9WXJ6_9PEZI|nr:hypothetical protein JX265_001372 [Neoarthrinium moseri]